MKQKTLLTALLAMLALTASAVAHDGHRHQAMGTVEAIDAEQITLAMKGDESKTFTLTEETAFTRGQDEAARAETAVGERAVVMYETKDEINVAIEVKLPVKADQTRGDGRE